MKNFWFIVGTVAAFVVLVWLSNSSSMDSSGLDWTDTTGGGTVASTSQWANFISRFEGSSSSNLNHRNNNPGNLRVTGDLGTDANGFGIFSSWDLGMQALIADLNAKVVKYPSDTLAQIMQRYAPAQDGNDPTSYASYIARNLGVSVSDTLSSIFGNGGN